MKKKNLEDINLELENINMKLGASSLTIYLMEKTGVSGKLGYKQIQELSDKFIEKNYEK